MSPERAPRRWLILAVLCTVLLTVVLDNAILFVAVPSLTGDLGASTAQTQWMISAYSLAMGGLLIAAGGLADRYGRRRALLLGIVLFGLGSLCAALAQSPAQVIASRAAMGVGAAFLMSCTLAVIVRVFDDESRPRAIAVWTAVSSAGVAGGPVIGGFLLQHFWWGSVFLINVPVAAVGLLATVLFVPESRDPSGDRPDLMGGVLSALGIVLLVWAVTSSERHSWGSAQVYLPALLGVVFVVAFCLWERRVASPMLDLSLFAKPQFRGAVLGGLLAAFGLGGSLFLLTQDLQLVLGYSPLEAGLRTTPLALTLLVVSSTVSVRVSRRLGAPATMVTGMALVAAGLVAVSASTSSHSYPVVLVGLILFGAGSGLVAPVAATALMSAIPPDRAGSGSGVNGTLQELGNSIGVSVLGVVLLSRFAAELPGGFDSHDASSYEAATRAAQQGPHPRELLHTVQDAFSAGLATSQLVGAAAVLLGGVVAGLLLKKAERAVTVPAQPTGPAPVDESARTARAQQEES